MGMAASQARFLQLTARKTNVEYMGQQINQERLALANQSAGLFEKMLTMEPPVPPSSLDDKYFTQGYMFVDPNDTIYKRMDWVAMDDESVPASALNIDYTSYTNGTPALADGTTEWADASGDDVLAAPTVAGGSAVSTSFDLTSLVAGFTDEENTFGTDAELAAFMESVGITPQEDTNRSVIRFVTVEHDVYDPDGNYTQVQRQTPAILEFDNLERLINVNFLDNLSGGLNTATAGAEATVSTVVGSGSGTAVSGADYSTASAGTNTTAPTQISDFTGTGGSISGLESIGGGEELAYSGQFDEVSFNDDMNRYEFNKAAYDYQIERINLETAKIQKQDKSLELKMKQLDTEHRAIQTELDAVQKVIQKNIESSFKTFA